MRRFTRKITAFIRANSWYSDLPTSQRRTWFHLLLFSLTLLSTWVVGAVSSPAGGLWYAAGIITILGVHEFGHFFAARYFGIAVSLPYFIPFPFSIFGTLGAVIRMRSMIPNRRALLYVGAAGPLAGAAVSLPLAFAGIRMSEVVSISSMGESYFSLGDSLLFSLLTRLAAGPLEPGYDIVLHPLAFAGWVGLFVTALNLLPISQLDGGHIIYAMFREKSRYISRLFYAGLVFIFLFFTISWALPLILLPLLRPHPPTALENIHLQPKERFLGYAALVIFILTFIPVPFHIADGLIPLLTQFIAP